MINGNELRIGNYLLFDGKINKVSSVHSDETIRFFKESENGTHGCYSLNYGGIQPITLKQEILAAAGFTSNIQEGLDALQIGDMCLEIGKKSFITVNEGEYIITGIADIKYVHQLQNLYHALTGEELKIKF